MCPARSVWMETKALSACAGAAACWDTQGSEKGQAASQGHCKKDNSPHQNMLGLDWERLALHKQVCWQSSLPIICHARSYKEWDALQEEFPSSAQVQLPAGHAASCDGAEGGDSAAPPLAPAQSQGEADQEPAWGRLPATPETLI